MSSAIAPSAGPVCVAATVTKELTLDAEGNGAHGITATINAQHKRRTTATGV
ncbi:MAG: hypothetical protein H0W76_18935 [Pyrinomonadaceae bacterium]|nr:hypothetical protein [Pyrinomonadaceae bacterium]